MNYETACNRSNAICVGCTLATPSIMQCNSNAIQPHVPCSWDCDLCPRGCDCNAPYQLLLLLNLLTCRQITVNNLQKILLLQRNQHFYLLTFRSLSETFIGRSMFNSSSGSCHDSDATWQDIGRATRWATCTTDFLPRSITIVARTGRGIEQTSSDEGLW